MFVCSYVNVFLLDVSQKYICSLSSNFSDISDMKCVFIAPCVFCNLIKLKNSLHEMIKYAFNDGSRIYECCLLRFSESF